MSSRPYSASPGTAGILDRWARRLDLPLAFTTLLIAAYGLVIIRSATGGSLTGLFARQAFGVFLGILLMAALARSDYRAVAGVSRPIYVVNLFLLVAVFAVGRQANGAQRWIPLIGPLNIQPSEFAKVALIITLSRLLVDMKEQIQTLRGLLLSLLHVAVPAALIYKQPDLGTALVVLTIWFAVTTLAGARIRHLAGLLILGMAAFGLLWVVGGVKSYQKQRLESFLNPSADPLATGYHLRQSRIAIGSGRLRGKGLFKGTQKKLHFVPERHTDFIFTVVGEELGFVGCCALLLLYYLLIMRSLQICASCEDLLGQLMAGGIAALFAFHVIVNIGMTLGVMPVVGVPLPLFSYAPSNLLSNLASVGLLQSIHRRRHKIMFDSRR